MMYFMPPGKQAASPKKIPKWVQCSDRFFLKAFSGCTAPPAFATGEQAIEAAYKLVDTNSRHELESLMKSGLKNIDTKLRAKVDEKLKQLRFVGTGKDIRGFFAPRKQTAAGGAESPASPPGPSSSSTSTKAAVVMPSDIAEMEGSDGSDRSDDDDDDDDYNDEEEMPLRISGSSSGGPSQEGSTERTEDAGVCVEAQQEEADRVEEEGVIAEQQQQEDTLVREGDEEDVEEELPLRGKGSHASAVEAAVEEEAGTRHGMPHSDDAEAAVTDDDEVCSNRTADCFDASEEEDDDVEADEEGEEEEQHEEDDGDDDEETSPRKRPRATEAGAAGGSGGECPAHVVWVD